MHTQDDAWGEAAQALDKADRAHSRSIGKLNERIAELEKDARDAVALMLHAEVERDAALTKATALEAELAATKHEMASVKTAAGLFEARAAELEAENERLRRANENNQAAWFNEVGHLKLRISGLEAENAKLRKVVEAALDLADCMGPCGAIEGNELYCKFDDCQRCALVKAVDNV